MGTLAIIGIDPGTTSAYAIIDLEGKLLGLASGKELTISEMIVRILPLCQPILVSTDKAKVPFFVEQFATKIGGQLVVPEFDLLKEEKRELLAYQTEQKEQSEDHHQADALAAALFAYKKYYPLLQKIKHFIRYLNTILNIFFSNNFIHPRGHFINKWACFFTKNSSWKTFWKFGIYEFLF